MEKTTGQRESAPNDQPGTKKAELRLQHFPLSSAKMLRKYAAENGFTTIVAAAQFLLVRAIKREREERS
jgi:hypothetical protein